jgi:predicted O-methyltransferase YrrM
MNTRNADNDLGYFDIYGPAPMMEAMAKLSPSPQINSTTTHYGPFLYGLGKLINMTNCLEIGLATGWSSGFMAWAVKENSDHGVYYGIDIGPKVDLINECRNMGLPVGLIAEPSAEWLEKKTGLFLPESLDLVFDDGWHNTQYVIREVEAIYPLLKKNGYLIMHDVYATCEEVYSIVVNDPRYKWEHLRLLPCYGLGILRKMEGKEETITKDTDLPEGTIQGDLFALNPFSPQTPYAYGIFIYTLARAISAMGHLECLEMGGTDWSAHFLKTAVEETNNRYGSGSWYGNEIMRDRNLDLAILESTEQLETIYPRLKDKGFGYALIPDVDTKSIIDKYSVEHVSIGGYRLFRKMENYIHKNTFSWPEGDQR